MEIKVISKSIGIRMRCDNQTVTTSVTAYGIRVQSGVDWQKIRELIADGTVWGKITGNINEQSDLMELIAGLPQDEKEIVNVLSYGGTMPSNPEDGDRWIDPENKLIYVYSESDGWGTDEPSTDVIYIAADTSHIYHFDGTQFVDVTGQKIDDVIYVRSIDDPALEAYTDAGMYTVCVSSRFSSKYYTLAITYSKGPSRIGVPPRTTYMQTLFNRDGYYTRSKVNSGDWSDWDEYLYASKADVQEAKDWAVVGWVL